MRAHDFFHQGVLLLSPVPFLLECPLRAADSSWILLQGAVSCWSPSCPQGAAVKGGALSSKVLLRSLLSSRRSIHLLWLSTLSCVLYSGGTRLSSVQYSYGVLLFRLLALSCFLFSNTEVLIYVLEVRRSSLVAAAVLASADARNPVPVVPPSRPPLPSCPTQRSSGCPFPPSTEAPGSFYTPGTSAVETGAARTVRTEPFMDTNLRETVQRDLRLKELEKDARYMSSALDSIQAFSPKAQIFVLVHKMDLLPPVDREVAMRFYQRLVRDIAQGRGTRGFARLLRLALCLSTVMQLTMSDLGGSSIRGLQGQGTQWQRSVHSP